MTIKSPGLIHGYGNSKLLFLRIGAVLLTAATFPLMSAPISLWPLHWVAWIPFLWAIHAQEGKGKIWIAYISGTTAHTLIFYWIPNLISNFTNISRPVSIILFFALCSYLSLQWILFAALIPKLRRRFPRGWIFLSPAFVVTLEFLMPQLFRYMQGVSHYQVIPIIQISSITGIYGVSYLLFWTNCFIFDAGSRFRVRDKFRWIAFLVLVSVVGLVVVYGLLRQQQYKLLSSHSHKLKVGLVQSNITPEGYMKTGFNQAHSILLGLSQEAVKKGAQWVIWSEGEFKPLLSLPYSKLILLRDSRLLQRPILLGTVDFRHEKGKKLYMNSAIHVDHSTGFGKRYDKQILVPFGEYMPFEKQLNFIYRLINWKSRLSPGKDSVVQSLEGIPYAFLICYEAIYPSLARKAVRKGAQILINITYDGWFGRTSAPYQPLKLAAIRSAETGVPLIRLGTTGISTSVDALGRMQALSPLYQRRVLLHTVNLIQLPSLYMRIGDVFAWLCVGTILAAIVFMWFKRSSF